MLPVLTLPFGALETGACLLALGTAAAGAFAFVALRRHPQRRLLWVGLGVACAAAVPGASLWSSLEGEPGGHAFFGALAAGIGAFWLFARVLVPAPERAAAFDVLAVCLAIGLVFARLRCFAEGCCYGRPTTVAWAVTIWDERARMPLLGIPVHPVQLYEAAAVAALASALVAAWRRGSLRGRGMPAFLLGYGLVRSAMQFFRAEDSPSAHVEYALLAFGAAAALLPRRRWLLAIPAAAAVTALLLSPAAQETPIAPGLTEVALRGEAPLRGNLLFAVLDHQVEARFGAELVAFALGRPPGLAQIAWRRLLPIYSDLYGRVVRIDQDDLNAATLAASLRWLDQRDEPFDVALLTHGMANHIEASPGFDAISYRDLAGLSFRNLRAVYMQSCDGATLAADWHRAGAKEVIAFSGNTGNYFFYAEFARALVTTRGDVSAAYSLAARTEEEAVRSSPLYRFVLWRLGTPLARAVAPPILSVR